jgi:hypothetical protein
MCDRSDSRWGWFLCVEYTSEDCMHIRLIMHIHSHFSDVRLQKASSAHRSCQRNLRNVWVYNSTPTDKWLLKQYTLIAKRTHFDWILVDRDDCLKLEGLLCPDRMHEEQRVPRTLTLPLGASNMSFPSASTKHFLHYLPLLVHCASSNKVLDTLQKKTVDYLLNQDVHFWHAYEWPPLVTHAENQSSDVVRQCMCTGCPANGLIIMIKALPFSL